MIIKERSKRRICKISTKNKIIYYNEIIDELTFKELYLPEKPICTFSSRFIAATKPFKAYLIPNKIL